MVASQSLFRKVSPSIWRSTGDATIHGHIDLDLTDYFSVCPEARDRSPLPLVMYLVHKSMGHVPELQRILRFKSLWSYRKFSLVLPIDGDQRDMRFLRVKPKADWTLKDFELQLAKTHHQIRDQGEQQTRFAFRLIQAIPSLLLPYFLQLAMFLIYDLGVTPRILGFKEDPFGPVVISNFGSLGLLEAFPALIPLARNATTLGLGRIQKKALVVKDQVVPRICVPMSFSVDHRYLDGSHCAVIFRDLENALFELVRSLQSEAP